MAVDSDSDRQCNMSMMERPLRLSAMSSMWRLIIDSTFLDTCRQVNNIIFDGMRTFPGKFTLSVLSLVDLE